MAIERFQCPNCRADMEFDPETSGMKCSYCGTKQEVTAGKTIEVKENPLSSAALRPDPSRIRRLSEISKEFTCNGCGATVQFEPPQVAGTCPFCAASIVVQPKESDPLIAPDGVLPFAVPKPAAASSVGNWLASRWFAPNALKAIGKPEGIQGVYLPFWTFDANTLTPYRGSRGDYYYETVTRLEEVNGRQVERQVQERRTEWREVEGEVPVSFNDILVPASKSINPAKLSKLAPWELGNIKPYEPAYVAGFQSQRYQVELAEGFGTGKAAMEAAVEAAIRGQIGGDEQQISGYQIRYSGLTFKHLLLPVWIGAYRLQGKAYQVIVNAQTGEVQGERPYSFGKLVLLIAAVLLVVMWIAASSR